MDAIKFHRYINYIVLSLVISIGFVNSACTSSSERGEPSSQLESPEPTQTSPPVSTPAPAIVEGKPSAAPILPTEALLPPTPTETPSSGLHLVSDLAVGELHHLWIDPDGQLWIASEAGVQVFEDNVWVVRSNEPAERIIGVDAEGKIWVIMNGESDIGFYDSSGSWEKYGKEHGWTTPDEVEYLSPGYGDGLVTDPQGGIWLATGRDDVRRFDPDSQSWEVFQAADLGYNPIPGEEYQGHFLTDVALSRSQKVWVGDCIGEGVDLKGQGIHWTDGESWFEAPDTSRECVQDIEIDADGKMWVGGFDNLLMYDPDGGFWTRLPLPPWDRRQLVADITLDQNGNPWIEVMKFGGAGPLGSIVRYHLQGDEWHKDFEGWFSSLALGEGGVAWLCSEGTIYRVENGKIEDAGKMEGSECELVVDGTSRIWVTNYKDLWWLDP
jgi:sugar lactone lactonase YvrE